MPHPASAPDVTSSTRRPTLPMPTCVEGSPQRGARGRRWTQFRRAKLRANPVCQWINIDGTGCRLLSSTVDHIVPLAELTPEQVRAAEYDWDGTQCLCRQHAIEKNTQDALRGKRRAREWGMKSRSQAER